METNVIFGKIYSNGFAHNHTAIAREVTDQSDHHKCPDGWRNFWTPFIYVREELELAVGLLGCLTNILNVWVFTRKNMRNPTSTIFTALALADFLFLFQQVVASSLHISRKYNGDSRTFPHVLIEQTIFQYSFEIFHGWSIYLTVLLAVWRFFGVTYPIKSRRWYRAESAKWAILSVLMFSTVGIFLICLTIQIQDGGGGEGNHPNFTRNETGNGGDNDGGGGDMEAVRRHRFLWIYVTFVKFVPCILLTIFFVGLIASLVKAKKRREQLRRSRAVFRERILEQSSLTTAGAGMTAGSMSILRGGISASGGGGGGGSMTAIRKDQIEFDRTTKTLVLVLLFLSTEFPFGVVELLSDPPTSPTFYMECYFPLLSFFVFDELISSAASFFVYFFMSNTFRGTFTLNVKNIFKNVGLVKCAGQTSSRFQPQ